jgi:zinc finger CCHC domain-containing protein 9
VPEDPENPLPFATCFVCKNSGHLVSTCPSNKSKGIYPNGGCCKLCGETSHLAKDCEIERKGKGPCLLSVQLELTFATEKHKDTLFVGSGKDAGADEDDFHVISRGQREVDDEEEANKPKGKIKRLVGGKFIVRVDDEPVKKAPPKKPPPMTKVKTVVF